MHVWAEGNDLCYRAAKGALTPELRQKLSENKRNLLTALGENVRFEPATSSQQRLFFLEHLDPGTATYTIALALTCRGALNLDLFERSLNLVVSRHEPLRTTFRILEGETVQAIHPEIHIPVECITVSSQAEAIAEAERIARLPFDVERGPLIRATVITISADESLVFIPTHHIVTDGWSLGILVRELGIAYDALARDESPELDPLPEPFAAQAHWETKWLKDALFQKQVEYWKRKLAGHLPVLSLPTDRPRPAIQSYRGALYHCSFDDALSDRIRLFSRSVGLTPFMTLLTAYKILFHRYSGQSDILIGTPMAGRIRPATRNLIGYYANTLVLRTSTSSSQTAAEALHETRAVVLEAFENQQVPFERLVEEVHPERSTSHAPIFQTMFVQQNTPSPSFEFGGLQLTPTLIDCGMTKFDLTLSISEQDGHFDATVEYSTDLFERESIIRLKEHYCAILHAIMDNPSCPVGELPMLSPAEITRQLDTWNATDDETFPIECVHVMFERMADTYPDDPAVQFEDQCLTYAELNARANGLANHLHELGAAPDTIVAIAVDRSLDMIVSVLGVLKAGAAYLPLDLAYPTERITFMLSDSQAPLLITSSEFAQKLTGYEGRTVLIDQQTQKDSQNPNYPVSTTNLAYVIYTSGSTGRPKGTLIEHAGLCNLLHELRTRVGEGRTRRVLQFCSFSFDPSVWEMFMALTVGSTLVLARNETLGSGPALVRLLEDAGITTLSLPTSVLKALPLTKLPKVDTIIVGGEACPLDMVQAWAPGRRMFNCYGPTESTICVTMWECNAHDTTPPPIGRALANTKLYILGQSKELLPQGAAGELYIGGIQLARGYLARPELTHERFVPNPFVNGDRLYRTGDLVRYRKDGAIEFLGRVDHQIKLRGFRIELGEIETTLQAHPSVHQACVHLLNGKGTEPRLVAYVLRNGNGAGSVRELELSQFLRDRLPDYMLPSAYVSLDTFPLTPNGKIDRAALPMPTARRSDARAHAKPRTPDEETLVTIWKDLLRADEVGIEDNFFELGGHSLLAMRLLSRIHEQFDVEVPLRSFFESPTIAGTAALIASKGAVPVSRELATSESTANPLVAASRSIVPIQPKGSNTPLFLAAPAGGVVFPYYALAAHIDENQPVYALQDPGLDEDHAPFETIEELATHYVGAMQSIQPSGPYMIGGWSYGGNVAFEMAQQLTAQGQRVSLVLMLDTQGGDMRADASQSLVKKAQIILGHLWDGLLLIPATMPYVYEGLYVLAKRPRGEQSNGAKRFSVIEYVRWAWADLLMTRAGIPTELSRESVLTMLHLPTFRRVFLTMSANGKTLFKYEPKVYPGRIVLFRATEQPPMRKSAKSRTLDWERFTRDGVDVYDIEGNHVALMKEPAIQSVVKNLMECIARTKESP